MQNSFDCDVVISGGGLAGAPLALALAENGFSVILIDAEDPATATDAAFDGRVSAIAFASCRMFEALGIWDEMKKEAQPINDIMVTDGHVRGATSPLFLHFDHTEIGDEPLGHLIENRHNRVVLIDAVRRHKGIDYRAPLKVTGSRPDRFGHVLELSDGSEVTARLAVGADGRRSILREQAGIKLVSWDCDQIGIVTTVEHEHDHLGVAQEYFLPSGPFAILPMMGRRSSLVWTERTRLAKALLELDRDRFEEELRERFGNYLGEITPTGPVWSYPLAFQLARSYYRNRMVLVADAAHGVHPIAGQGLNLGLRDVAALAEVLTDARRLGQDFGAPDVLERYQQWRRFDNVSLALVMDGFNRLFSNDIGVMRHVRDLGLGIVNQIGPARRYFMRQAGGDVGELPKLLQGQTL